MTKLEPSVAPRWLYYFMGSSLDAAAKRVTGRGDRIAHAASEVPGGGWIAHCLDPQGAAFALLSDQR
ncbi:MAG: Glyoxalase protein [Sphingomonas bacterium]|nr:Glyoxalase protein [Sphingomonas bacterium]